MLSPQRPPPLIFSFPFLILSNPQFLASFPAEQDGLGSPALQALAPRTHQAFGPPHLLFEAAPQIETFCSREEFWHPLEVLKLHALPGCGAQTLEGIPEIMSQTQVRQSLAQGPWQVRRRAEAGTSTPGSPALMV